MIKNDNITTMFTGAITLKGS